MIVANRPPHSGEPVHHSESCPMVTSPHGWNPSDQVAIPSWLAALVGAHVKPCGRCGGGS